MLQVIGAGAVPVLLHTAASRQTDEETLVAALDVLERVSSSGIRIIFCSESDAWCAARWSSELPRFGAMEVLEQLLQIGSDQIRSIARRIIDLIAGIKPAK